MGTPNVNRGPCNVIMGLSYVVMGPRNVKKKSWNLNRGP